MSRPAARYGMPLLAAVALAAAGCGSSSSSPPAAAGAAAAAAIAASTTAASAAPPSASAAVASPGTMLSVASVAGLGSVVVDGAGRTVYLLTADGTHNVACTDASGCTKVWPDLPLPDGTSKAGAGQGLNASLLSTEKSDDGETYPTYGGWLLYEFAGDSAPGQGHGQGLKSFGGTWYAVSAAGKPVLPAAAVPSAAPTSAPAYKY